jgi:hypothetical protein
MCDIKFDGHNKFWHDDWRTARKPHRCHACGATIISGEHYLYHRSMHSDADSPTIEKMCAACDALMVEFGAVDGHPGRCTPASLAEYLIECINEDEDQVYDEEKDEFLPGPQAKRWLAMLEEMKARKERAL